MSTFMSNRNSTPDASLRPPPGARNTLNGMSPLRASTDLSSPSIRPSSEVYPRRELQNTEEDTDKAASQWIADIEDFENTLEGMASATLDQEFKDELSAIEQWFRVLSEAERTAALYALLQQTTQIQNRFFIQVLQEMAKGHPPPGVLSPSTVTEKENMSKRMSEVTDGLQSESQRNSVARPPPSPFGKRASGLPAEAINSLFPEAVAAIANQRQRYTEVTGNQPPTNRNSLAINENRLSVAPAIQTPAEAKENLPLPSPTPWTQRQSAGAKPPTSTQPMGQFSQPLASAGLTSAGLPSAGLPSAGLASAGLTSAALRSPRPPGLGQDGNTVEPALISPYPGGSWASMTNTPMVPNFGSQQAGQPSQADMVANATAMKLAAMSTVNNRIMLDDVKKFRRPRPGEQGGHLQLSPGILGSNVIVVNESGQPVNTQLSPQQLAALQLQQQNAFGRRSRPNSPGSALNTGGLNTGISSFISPQTGGFLSAYDHSGLPTGMSSLSLGGYSHHEGYISDHSDARGRSPRGRRGTSKPPEDPTNENLLADIPAWLRSLRLHKYTDNLKDLPWQTLVELDEQGLEDRGVAAAGARKKMLKTFEQVKEARDAGKFS